DSSSAAESFSSANFASSECVSGSFEASAFTCVASAWNTATCESNGAASATDESLPDDWHPVAAATSQASAHPPTDRTMSDAPLLRTGPDHRPEPLVHLAVVLHRIDVEPVVLADTPRDPHQERSSRLERTAEIRTLDLFLVLGRGAPVLRNV